MHQIWQNARSTSARRVARSTIVIDERACQTIALLVDRAARQSTSALAIAIDEGCDCPTSRRSSALSNLGSLFSLSLFGNDLN